MTKKTRPVKMAEKGEAPKASEVLGKIQRVAGGDLGLSKHKTLILTMGGPSQISLCYTEDRVVRAFTQSPGQTLQNHVDFTNWADLRTFLIDNNGLGPDYPYPDKKKDAK